MHWIKFVVLFLLQKASSLELDDVEYDKMPQISALEDYFRCLLYNGTYCYVVVDVFADPPNDLMNMIQEYSRQRVLHYNHSHLERGVCVTKTCKQYIGTKNLDSPSDLHEILTNCLNDTFWHEYELQAHVATQMCTNKEQAETIRTDWSDWLVLLLIIAVLTVNILGTGLDSFFDEETKKNMSKPKQIVMCFSVRRNWNHLKITTHHNERLQVLKGIHAIRTYGASCVIGAHAELLRLSFIGNPHDYEKAFHKLHFIPAFNGTFAVYPFFVIASFLLVYNLEIAGEKMRLKWKTVPLILLHRFFRMIPPMFLVVAFTATWMRHMGTGPLWGKYVLAPADQCRSYWWSHLLFVNNYVFDNKLCNIQTWHLAADTQLFLLGLVVYLVSQGNVWLRNVLLLLMLILGIIFPPLHVYWYDLDAIFTFHPELVRFFYDDSFNLLKIYGHTNMALYAIGMYSGYKVIEWQRKGVSLDNNKMMYFIFISGWPIFVGMTYGLNYFLDVDTPLWVRMFIQATIRPLIGGLTAVAIIAMTMKINYFRGFLEWDGWVIFGKVNYSVFLVHLNLVHILLGLQIYLVDLHYLPFVMVYMGVTGLCYLIAIPFYLMVEAPLNPVLKLLISPVKSTEGQDTFIADVIQAYKKKREEKQEKNATEESYLNNHDEKLKTT